MIGLFHHADHVMQMPTDLGYRVEAASEGPALRLMEATGGAEVVYCTRARAIIKSISEGAEPPQQDASIRSIHALIL